MKNVSYARQKVDFVVKTNFKKLGGQQYNK